MRTLEQSWYKYALYKTQGHRKTFKHLELSTYRKNAWLLFIPIIQPPDRRVLLITMAPKLELCFTMRGYMSRESSVNLNAIKSGPTRIIVPITHGYVEGSGVKVELLPGGGDWILVCSFAGMHPIEQSLHSPRDTDLFYNIARSRDQRSTPGRSYPRSNG